MTVDTAKLLKVVRHAVRGRHAPADSVDDCVQQTLLCMLQSKAEIRDPYGYAAATARNVVAGEIRRFAGARGGLEMELFAKTLPSKAPTPYESAERSEQMDTVSAVLRAMPALKRELIERFYFRGQSQETICEELGISPTVYRLEKCRAKAVLVERARHALAKGSH